MPSVNFSIIWPDGDKASYYSPSTIIHDYIKNPHFYELESFKRLCDDALNAASERVYQRFGYYCSAASDEKEKIAKKYNQLVESNVIGKVKVIDIS